MEESVAADSSFCGCCFLKQNYTLRSNKFLQLLLFVKKFNIFLFLEKCDILTESEERKSE